jgi:hypothetical protein
MRFNALILSWANINVFFTQIFYPGAIILVLPVKNLTTEIV